MCLAKEYTEQLLDIHNKINAEIRRLCAEVNQADQYDLDMLHMIENTNFNASEGYLLAKQIKDNRVFRRQIKNELETMKQLKNNYIDKGTEILIDLHEIITKRDIVLKSHTKYKIYEPKVLGKEFTDPVAFNQSKSIPVSSSQPPVSIKAIHKRSNEEIRILDKLDDKHYLVKRKNGNREVLCSKHILNVESSQSAK